MAVKSYDTIFPTPTTDNIIFMDVGSQGITTSRATRKNRLTNLLRIWLLSRCWHKRLWERVITITIEEPTFRYSETFPTAWQWKIMPLGSVATPGEFFYGGKIGSQRPPEYLPFLFFFTPKRGSLVTSAGKMWKSLIGWIMRESIGKLETGDVTG